jgi:hypothetical protein
LSKKTLYQVTNWQTKEKKYAHLRIKNFEPVETPPDSLLEANIEEEWDGANPYQCITCKLPFDTALKRMPWLLPCHHNVCL